MSSPSPALRASAGAPRRASAPAVPVPAAPVPSPATQHVSPSKRVTFAQSARSRSSASQCSRSSRRVTRESVRAARRAAGVAAGGVGEFGAYEKARPLGRAPVYERLDEWEEKDRYRDRNDYKDDYEDGCDSKDAARVRVQPVMPPFGPRVRLARGNANVRFDSRMHGFKRDAGAFFWAVGGGLLCGLFGCCFGGTMMD